MLQLRSFFRPFLAITTAVVVLAATLTSGVATAQANTSDDGSSIWCGLWAGSNFDIPDSCKPPTGGGSPSTHTNGAYVALGDSVAAGYGLPAGTYTSTTDTTCARSSQGYPNLVAASLHMPLTNAACSGATVGDLFTKQAVKGPNITAQLDTAFANGTPSLMTLTAGANDVHWNDFIANICYTTDCTADAYTTAFNGYQYLMKLKLDTALSIIYARSHGTPPPVYITGYYDPVSDACAAQQTAITPAEISWIHQRVASLNQTLQESSNKYSFVHFVPIDFTGHDICSPNSWLQPPSSAGRFHPTATGQAMIAKAVVTAIKQN